MRFERWREEKHSKRVESGCGEDGGVSVLGFTGGDEGRLVVVAAEEGREISYAAVCCFDVSFVEFDTVVKGMSIR